MKVLWLCNIMLPVIARQLGMPESNKEGWLSGLAGRLCKSGQQEVELGVCFPVSESPIKGVAAYEGGMNVAYYGFVEDTVHPEIYDNRLEVQLREIVQDFKPDVVHCFGTEYPHTLAMTKAFGRPERTLIGIQGLCFVYADHYMADLPKEIQTRTLFRDFVKKDNLLQQQEKYRMRGEFEKEALSRVTHVTGRTDWDKKWTEQINPGVQYHFMNETLRGQFYGPVWDRDACEPYRIFLSQGNYPIKGLHYMLQALPAIKEMYPEAHVCVAGDTITRFGTWKEKIKISNYGKYVIDLIKKYKLEESVTFLGRLNGEEMLAQYLKSHVFVSPSSIENSPNSVGEAMLLGMPVVSSDVGGVHNMLRDGEEGFLYPVSETDKLARHICYVFADENKDKVKAMGDAARRHALITHDPETNYRRLLEIYHEINLCV